MNLAARSGGSAEPLTATTRSDEVSYASSTSRRRRSITGTATSAVAPEDDTAASVPAASNDPVSTNVEPSATPSNQCANPHAWNSGAATTVVSPAFSGMTDSSATIG